MNKIKAKVIGLTGGMGAGKTSVASLFKLLDVPVYNADLRARFLMENDQNLIREIKEKFGSQSFSQDNTLNRNYIASIVFNDKNKLKELNALVHPVVVQDAKDWADNQNVLYVIKESALLIETINQQRPDKIIVVTSPLELRLQRLIRRDQQPMEDILKRLEAQLTESEQLKMADYIIYNDENHSLIQQVMDIYHKLNSEYKQN